MRAVTWRTGHFGHFCVRSRDHRKRHSMGCELAYFGMLSVSSTIYVDGPGPSHRAMARRWDSGSNVTMCFVQLRDSQQHSPGGGRAGS